MAFNSWSDQSFRILIYSHDTFGLGHLRRCRAIALSLAENLENASIWILSGSRFANRFSYHPRINVVRLPPIIKIGVDDYASPSGRDVTKAVFARRKSVITETTLRVQPHLFLADKEPWGLRGEIASALRILKQHGAHSVLGLRDILDDPRAIQKEWRRKDALQAVHEFYDEIWIYGDKRFFEPLSGVVGAGNLEDKIRYTGYLTPPLKSADGGEARGTDKRAFVLTTGGGGDGEAVTNWVFRAYEQDHTLSIPLKVILGPFMNAQARASFHRRATALDTVQTQDFAIDATRQFVESKGVIAMGGYNTFCEILAADRPALLLPRTTPRVEQLLRAERAERFGLVRMLKPPTNRTEESRFLDDLIAGLDNLHHQPHPSQHLNDLNLNGFENVRRRVNDLALEKDKASRLRQPMTKRDAPL
jgi:predicted glycosyltransferase